MRDGTLVGAWVARWHEQPDRPVLHDAREGWVTGAQLDQRTRAVAAALSGRGVGRGCRVLLSGATDIELVVVHIALLRWAHVVLATGPPRARVTHIVAMRTRWRSR